MDPLAAILALAEAHGVPVTGAGGFESANLPVMAGHVHGGMLEVHGAQFYDGPAYFIAGTRDGAYNMFGMATDPLQIMRHFVPNLEGGHVLEGCGHWTQQERPAEVTALLVPWLKSLRGRVV